jgi:hypothetical protein
MGKAKKQGHAGERQPRAFGVKRQAQSRPVTSQPAYVQTGANLAQNGRAKCDAPVTRVAAEYPDRLQIGPVRHTIHFFW